MRELVALAERIGPRVEKRHQPLQPVRRGDQDRRQRDRQQQEQAEKQPPVEPAQEQDAEGDGDDDDEGAEVRLEQQQGADAEHHGEQRQEPRSSVCRSGCCACRKSALRTA